MYCIDLLTGNTSFRTFQPAARRVTLVAQCGEAPALRVPMNSTHGHWEANAILPSGWVFYFFDVDGKPDWDRDEGQLRTCHGQPCSLALITHAKHSLTPAYAS